MEQLAEFAANHWPLFVALIIVTLLLALNLASAAANGVANVTPAMATQLINHEDAVVLDVRDPSEIAQGKILDSIHIPLGRLKSEIKTIEKYKTRPVIVYCRVGNRSASACSTLRDSGFEKLYNLKGGVNAWQNADLPLTR